MTQNTDDNRWDVKRFEEWFRKGIESYVLNNNTGLSAFPAAARFLVRTTSLSAGLSNFASQLDAEHLDAFKQAVVNVFSSLEPNEKYVDVARHTLVIASSISAYQILKIIPQKIIGGFLDNISAESRRSLISTAVSAISDLSISGNLDAVDSMKRLIKNDNFHYSNTGRALIALCSADSRNLLAHLNVPRLDRLLHKQFDQYDDESHELRHFLMKQVYDIVGEKEFKKAVNSLPQHHWLREIAQQE